MGVNPQSRCGTRAFRDKKRTPRFFLEFSAWYARGDSNPYPCGMEPKGDVTLVKDFQSPPYHKGRASFPTLQKIFWSRPAEYLLNHSTL